MSNKKSFLSYFLMISIFFFAIACSKKEKKVEVFKQFKIETSTKKANQVEIVKPAENLTPGLQTLSGKWQGAWIGVAEATLVVKEISKDKAKIYYSTKKYDPMKIPGIAFEIEADVIDGKNPTIFWQVKERKETYKFILGKNGHILRGLYTKGTDDIYVGMRKSTDKRGSYSKTLDLSDVKIKDQDTGLGKDWAKKAVFMEIYVRSFKDSDGDGIGDFKGLTSKLDYLKNLGIGGIWLMPSFSSSDKDHGYAVENYRDIEEDYGTIEDFEEFLKEAHKRKIGVILDYVINHSSSSNAIFEDSKLKNSSKRNWFRWKNKAPKGWNVGWRVGGPNPWPKTKYGHYYSVFFNGLPDWNLKNPEVMKFHYNNMKFWLNKGVDGFRFDAVGHLFEKEPNVWDNHPDNPKLVKKLKAFLNKYTNRFMVTEATTHAEVYAKPAGCTFGFGLQKGILGSARSGKAIGKMIKFIDENPMQNMAIFLSNHDGFVGDRTFKEVKGDDAKYKLAATTYLLLHAIPFIYYGEEVGMDLASAKISDDQLRAPMSWTDDEDNAGFTTSKIPYRLVARNVDSKYNAQDQVEDEDSIFSHYKKVIALRKSNDSLSLGSYKHIKIPNNKTVFAFIREYKDEKTIVAINYSQKDENVILKVDSANKSFKPINAESEDILKSSGSSTLKVEIPAQDFIIYKMTK